MIDHHVAMPGTNLPGAEPHMLLARDVGESIARVAAELELRMLAATSPERLTVLEARLLRLALDPKPQGELAVMLGCDAPRVSSLTRSLEDRGLLRRVRSRSDYRVRRSELTDDGAETLIRISARLVALSPIPSALDTNQLAELLGLLACVEEQACAHPMTSVPPEVPDVSGSEHPVV